MASAKPGAVQGASGERSIKKIDRASDKASRGLGTLSERASSLRRSMRLLGGVVAGAGAAGGLVLLVKRSLDTADAIAKIADKAGVATDFLQELRYAGSQTGVAARDIDDAFTRLNRRLGLFVTSGGGPAAVGFKELGIEARDAGGAVRSTESVFAEIVAKLEKYENTAQKAAVASAFFGEDAGPRLVNLLSRGSAGIDEFSRKARDLGLVLDEELLRDAERANDELSTLGTVLSTNVTRAVVEHADAIAELAGQFTEALPTLIGWVSSFGQWIGLIEQTRTGRLAEIREEIAEIDEAMTHWYRRLLEWDGIGALLGNEQNGPLKRRRDELVAELADLERQMAEAAQTPPPVTPAATPAGSPAAATPDDPVMTAEQQARRLVQIEQRLNSQLFQLRYQGAERIRAEYRRLDRELERLSEAGADPEMIERLRFGAAGVRDDKLAELARREDEIADRRAQANKRLAESLGFELEALKKTERERFVDVALRRLSAEATPKQREEVERLAGALFDEQEKIKDANKAREKENQLRAEAKALTDQLRTAEEAYADETERLNDLLKAGAIDQETFGRASKDAYDRMLRASQDWSAGVIRALRDYGKEAGDAARQFEDVTSSALRASEDAWVNWARTGKLSVADFFSTLEDAALRAAYRLLIFKPLESFLEGLIEGFSLDFSRSSGGTTAPPILDAPAYGTGGFAVAHGGGVIGVTPLPRRSVDPLVFEGAPRFHGGGLVPGEVPVIAKPGEVIGWPEQMREAFGSEVVVQVIDQRGSGARPEVSSEWGPDGRRIIRVLIRDEVNRGIAQGAFDRALGGAFGINRRGVPR